MAEGEQVRGVDPRPGPPTEGMGRESLPRQDVPMMDEEDFVPAVISQGKYSDGYIPSGKPDRQIARKLGYTYCRR